MVSIDRKLSSRAVDQENLIDFVNRELVPVVEKIRLALLDTGGDVFGPDSAADGNFAVFDGTTGKLIAASGLTPEGVQFPAIVVIPDATLTVTADHIGKILECSNAAGCDITFNTGVMSANEWVEAFGTQGQVTFTQGTDFTIDKPPSLSRLTREAFCVARVTARVVGASTTSILVGDLEVT